MNRKNVNRIRFVLEELLPPILRDSIIFKYIVKYFYRSDKDHETLKENILNITEKQKQDIWGSVKNEILEAQASKKYSDFVSELMHGKNIIFNPQNFENFAEKVAKVYIIECSKKENIIQDYVWESDNEMRIEILNQIDKMENDNILYHDGKDWTLDE